MTHYHDFASIVSDELGSNSISISYPPRNPIKTSMLTTKILLTEVYRPDKVSFRLYGNPLFSWIIDEANSFYSLKDYTFDKVIYYPSPGALSLMGLDYDYESFRDQNF